ncbi:MAG TPA: hypothetical protein VEF06_14110, partial [Bryobacteraceae bacterium]|nr:hypothetical protein [Bryobacteraceae bacterium]
MRFLLAALIGSAALASAQIETFTIREEFGVSHPRQIIDFDLHSKPDPAKSYVIGPDGTEVPFQLLSGNRLAVETDLPARAQKTWRLYEGRAAHAAVRGIEVRNGAAYTELTNGLTGIRIPRAAEATDLAPVEGIRYRDGVWTAAGPNYLLDARERHLTAKALAVRFLERGPLKVVVELSYSFARPEDYYRCTVEMQADQPSILLEEDTNIDMRYQFLISPGLDPDEARYRGHFAHSAALGHFADGRVFTQPTDEDAIRRLTFDPPEPSCYNSAGACIQRMAVWDPWVTDSGWYWQFYNAQAADTANLFGIFAGRTSRALGAAFNGVGAYTTNSNGSRAAGIRVEINRRAPDARIFSRMRFDWSIFTGVKGEDLGGPSRQPTISRQMNLHSGINLNKVHRYPLDAELKAASKPLYMSESAVGKIRDHVRRDPQYREYLRSVESTAEYLLNYWGGDTAEKRAGMARQVRLLATRFLDAMVNGTGIYDTFLHYWM